MYKIDLKMPNFTYVKISLLSRLPPLSTPLLSPLLFPPTIPSLSQPVLMLGR